MLTLRQKQILDFITGYSKKKGVSPSLEEIKKHFRLNSVSNIHQHLEALKEKGYLQREKNQKRGIEIASIESLVKIPLLGIISAGGPVEAIRNQEPIVVPRSMLSRGANHYALKVSGISMIEEGISDGDIVIVREQPTVDDGEKAIAYMPDRNEVTLKRIYREKNRIKLVPANKYMKPFYETNVEIQGKVVGVLRNELQ